MRSLRQAWWRFVLAALAIVTGAALGAGLGWLHILFLAGRVSFAQTVAYQPVARLLVLYLPVTINGLGGVLLGGIVGILISRGAVWRKRTGRVFWTALQGFILGGIAGALLGYADIAVLSNYLVLADSDTASAWRENRSFLVMINAGVVGGVGFLVGAAVHWRG